MRKRRVVVTGTGVITNLGDSRDLLHNALCNGASGLRQVEKFSHPALHDPLVGEIASFDPADYLEKRNFRPLDRTSLLLTSAAQLALDDSGWTSQLCEKQPVGLVAGTTFCSVHTISSFDCRGLTEGPAYTSPLDFANTVINAAAGQCAIWHSLRGANSTVSSGITSALEAIGYAADLIQEGHEQAVLAGGVEELCVESLLGFQQAGLLCVSNGSLAEPPVPFDFEGTGFALSEGSALLMLEEFEAAQSRGANILAEVIGYGSGFDCGLTEVDGSAERRADSIAQSIDRALESANSNASSIDAISVSANGYAFCDRSELLGIRAAFNGRSHSVPMTATKTSLGETMGASGAIQTVEMIATMLDGRLSNARMIPSGDDGLAGCSRESPQKNTRACLLDQFGRDRWKLLFTRPW